MIFTDCCGQARPGQQPGKLVMTLLVRDEVDVVAANIRFHLDHGVDFIVATDNGSSDGTTEVLEEYARMGVLHLIHEPSRVFQQQAWVNRMGELACSAFAADLVFHSDADELWHPASGSLKWEFALNGAADALSVPVRNMVLGYKNGGERFPDDVAYQVASPIHKPVRKVMDEVAWRSFFLYRYPNKVIYRTRQGYLRVSQGNHDLELGPTLVGFCQQLSTDIEVLHFPVRGLEQFRRKTLTNGEGLANLELAVGSTGVHAWHVKRWYALLQQGRLTEEYRRLLDLADYLDQGVLKPLEQRQRRILGYFAPAQRLAAPMVAGG